MPAGLNVILRIWRITDQPDDNIGGAQPSGTVLYPQIYGRISTRRPTQALLEQGLEVPTIFTVIMAPPDNEVNMDLQHNDQFDVVFPQNNFYYGKRFIIIGIRHSAMTDSRAHLIITARRFEFAHSNLLQ